MLVVAAFLAGVLLLVDETHPEDGTRVVVTTVDAAGQPVANIPIQWGRWTRSMLPPSEKAELDLPRRGSTLSGADGTATWVLASSRRRDADELGCTVFARLPFQARALQIRGAQGTPARIDVGAIAFAELDVRTADGRAVRSEDLMLAFDDGTREEHVASTAFARAGDRVLVPIAGEWSGRVHVRAGLGEARSSRALLDPGSPAVLVLQPAPRLVATLLSPGNDPIRNTDVDLVPIDPGAKLTCLFEDWFAKKRKPNDARVTSTQTDDEGVMSVAVPFDPRSSPNVGDGVRQLDRLALRIEVHHPFGACWIAQLPIDAAVESGTTDLGAIRLARDEWMVCGRVVDDRGEPIEGAAMTSSDSEDVTIGIGNKGLPTRVTDEHGRFRMRIREPRAFVPVRDGYVSPPSIVLDPGTTDHEIVLQRCARMEFRCEPSTTASPERFALRWRTDVAEGFDRLHSWSEVLERLAPGRMRIEFTLDGIDIGLLPPEVELAPGSSTTYDVDLSECGLVTLRVVDAQHRSIGSARARMLDADRSLPVSANGVVRFAIPRRTASLTCEADGYVPVTGVYAHGEHVVVLERRP